MPSPTDHAWAAGFFDADGHVTITKSRGRGHGMVVTITGVHTPTLLMLQHWYGGAVRDPKNGAHRWYVSGEKARGFLRSAMPHLRVKRRQAELAVGFHDYAPGSQEREDRIQEIRAEKHRRWTLAGEEIR